MINVYVDTILIFSEFLLHSNYFMYVLLWCVYFLDSSVPNSIVCPIGYHCPTGSGTPVTCPAGYYTNTTGNWDCVLCPEGYVYLSLSLSLCVCVCVCVCVRVCESIFVIYYICRYYCLPLNETVIGEVGYHDCPEGYYCPLGTGLNWHPCPKGTYSQQINLYRVSIYMYK